MGKKIADKGATEAFIREHLNYSSDECLLWPFRLNSLGYGYAVVNGVQRGAHHWMCKLANGLPAGDRRHCAHSCGNPTCVNPRHLRWASPAENAADRYMHGTISYGEKSGRTPLTADDVRAIRSASNDLVGLSRKYGVSKGCIVKIRNRTRWPHISDSEAA